MPLQPFCEGHPIRVRRASTRAKDNELPRVVTATSTHQACPFDPVDDQLIPELVQLIADDTLGNPKSNFESELAELKPAQLLSEALLHAPIMPQPIVGVAMLIMPITLPTMSDQHQSPSPAAAAAGPAAAATAPATASVLLAAMADGIGDLGSPDYLNQLLYTPVVPVGRTVNAAMTDADKAEATACSDAAFAVDVARATCPSASPIPPTTNHFRPA